MSPLSSRSAAPAPTGVAASAAGGTLGALVAAREDGAATGIVRPRGDSGYPVRARLYRSIGFTDQARTREFRFS
jgi:hypothetical protein